MTLEKNPKISKYEGYESPKSFGPFMLVVSYCIWGQTDRQFPPDKSANIEIQDDLSRVENLSSNFLQS